MLLTPTGPLADQQARSFLVSKYYYIMILIDTQSKTIYIRDLDSYYSLLSNITHKMIQLLDYNSSIINRDTPSPHELLQHHPGPGAGWELWP